MGVGGNNPPRCWELKVGVLFPSQSMLPSFGLEVCSSWVQNPLLYFNLGLLIYRIAVSFFIPLFLLENNENLPGPIQADGRWSNSIS